MGSLTAKAHCEMWCRLYGIAPVQSDVLTALRTVELPDCRHGARATQLSPIERLATWLAVSRLRHARTLVLIEPERGLAGKQVHQLQRLIDDAVGHHRQILIVGSDPGLANACGAQPLFVSTVG